MDLQQQIFRIPGESLISLGLEWSFRGKAPADLDLAAVAFDEKQQFVDVVFFNHPFPGQHAEGQEGNFWVSHSSLPYMFLTGDSRTGGEEDLRLLTEAERCEGGRKPRIEAPPLYRRHQHHQLAKHSMAHDRLLVDAAHVFDVRDQALHWREQYKTGLLREIPREAEKVKSYTQTASHSPHIPLSDEAMVFHFANMPPNVATIMICVTSYTGVDFSRLSLVRLTLRDEKERSCPLLGSIDLQQSTGKGTANLCACITRVPAAATTASVPLWDLRELNIRCMGFTFVDLLPAMQKLLGIPPEKQTSLGLSIPNYSLQKPSRGVANTATAGRGSYGSPLVPPLAFNTLLQSPARALLADLRFSVGWDGEFDLDAFVVFLDKDHHHVAHAQPKAREGTVPSHVLRDRFACQHSGDCRSGVGHSGDSESIDVLAYALPPEVHTVVFGVRWVRAGASSQLAAGPASSSVPSRRSAPKSIVSVPGLYIRVQSRVLDHPYSEELDRWNVYQEVEQVKKSQAKASEMLSTAVCCTIQKAQRCRSEVLFLGALVRSPPSAALLRTPPLGSPRHIDVRHGDEVPMHALFPPEPRSVSEVLSARRSPHAAGQPQPASTDQRLSPRQRRFIEKTAVPSFSYLPLHDSLSLEEEAAGVGPAFSAVVSYTEALSSLIKEARVVSSQVDQALHGKASSDPCRPHRSPSLPLYRPLAYAKLCAGMSYPFGLVIQLLEIDPIFPHLPFKTDQRCHVSMWVHGESEEWPYRSGDLPAYPNIPFRSNFVVRDNAHGGKTPAVLSTSESDGSRFCACFLVHVFSSVRIVLYTRAALAAGNLRLMDHMDCLRPPSVWAVPPPSVAIPAMDEICDQEGKKSKGQRKKEAKELEKKMVGVHKDILVPLTGSHGMPEAKEDQKGPNAEALSPVVKLRLFYVSRAVAEKWKERQAKEKFRMAKNHQRKVENQINDSHREAFNWMIPT